MAKAVYENRSFTDPRTGEIVSYEFYGIVGIVNGKAREMRFKDLSAAEKLAFETIAAGDDPVSMDGLEVHSSNETGDVKVERKPDRETTGNWLDED